MPLPGTPFLWAKLIRGDGDQVTSALPLLDHLLDVGAVFEALLAAGAWGAALATLAARPLTGLDRARLVALAALHDVGKANAGFQARWRAGGRRSGTRGRSRRCSSRPS